MAQVYFHCSSPAGVILDRRGIEVDGLAEAQELAARAVWSFLNEPGADDWRDWVLHVSDDLGEEIFVMRFASLLGKPH
jgi:hypothetical protein